MIPPGFTLISRAYHQLSEADQSNAFSWLKWLLIEGKLQAYTFGKGEKNLIPAEYWYRLLNHQIVQVFRSGDFFYDIGYYVEDSAKVSVETQQWNALLADFVHTDQRPNVPDDAKAIKKDRGGRPAQHSDFVVEAVALLWDASEEDFPDVKSLVARTRAKYGDLYDKDISDTQARSLLTELHHRWKIELVKKNHSSK